MACFNPLQGWRSKTANTSGKRSIVFNRNDGFEDLPVQVPCGQCIGCRLERSRQWAIRCVHEASLYEDNCFITLTYDDANLPADGSLRMEDFQKFMKRLRKHSQAKIRYFHCGEYGEKFSRPHYHACIFNFNFSDRKPWKNTPAGFLYTSETLQSLWPFGYGIIGDVTFDSAAYVARYIMKKITGDLAEQHYNGRKPEYTTMSNSIGKGWYDKFKSDLFPHDKCIINGKEVNVPKVYRQKYEMENHFEALKLKMSRLNAAESHAEQDGTIRRLRDREKVTNSRVNLKTRNYESELS